MELLLITKNKLKIVMTSEDMKEYAISGNEGDTNENALKLALRSILEKANHQIDFDIVDGITVQMFTSKDGGCEMYVTKSIQKNTSLPVPIHRNSKKADSVFLFQTMQDLLDACYHLQNEEDIVQSSAYADREKSQYYLLLHTEERNVFGKNPCLYMAANEYGQRMKDHRTLWHLYEYCDCICKSDAIGKLGALA